MNREATFWSIVTRIGISGDLVRSAQDAGLFERETAPNDTIDDDTASDEIEESVAEPVDQPVDEPVEGSSNETVDATPDETANETSNTNEVKPQQQIRPTLSPFELC